MKRVALYLFFSTLIIFVQLYCSKKDTPCTTTSADKEEPEILKYIAANSINATRHSSGIYYEITEPGQGNAPRNTSKVIINYKGMLLNNRICDSASNKEWQMTSLLPGFQTGLPLIRKGGKIKLILPSKYGYGCVSITDQYGNERVPANSILVFDIELVDMS